MYFLCRALELMSGVLPVSVVMTERKVRVRDMEQDCTNKKAH